MVNGTRRCKLAYTTQYRWLMLRSTWNLEASLTGQLGTKSEMDGINGSGVMNMVKETVTTKTGSVSLNINAREDSS